MMMMMIMMMMKDITAIVEFENSKLNFAIMCNAQILI